MTKSLDIEIKNDQNEEKDNFSRELRKFTFQFLFQFQLPLFKNQTELLINLNDKFKIEDALELSINEYTLIHSAHYEFNSQKMIDTAQDHLLNFCVHFFSEYKNNLELIKPFLHKTEVSKISNIDLTLILMAITEKLQLSTPKKTLINTFVNLAKEYGQSSSYKFINAILDKLNYEF
jgi:N utilization substance protein B